MELKQRRVTTTNVKTTIALAVPTCLFGLVLWYGSGSLWLAATLRNSLCIHLRLQDLKLSSFFSLVQKHKQEKQVRNKSESTQADFQTTAVDVPSGTAGEKTPTNYTLKPNKMHRLLGCVLLGACSFK